MAQITRFHIKIEDNNLVFKSEEHKEMFKRWLGQWNGKEIELEINEKKSKRTMFQNNALHLWYELVAQELNNAGYTVQLVLKEKIDIDWDKDKFKTLLWHPAQEAILNKKSTTELRKTEDIDKVYEHLNRHLGEKFGVHIPFPNDENLTADMPRMK